MPPYIPTAHDDGVLHALALHHVYSTCDRQVFDAVVKSEHGSGNYAYSLQHNGADTVDTLCSQLFNLLTGNTTAELLYYVDVIAVMSVLSDSQKQHFFSQCASGNELKQQSTTHTPSSTTLPLQLNIVPTPRTHSTHSVEAGHDDLDIDHIVHLDINGAYDSHHTSAQTPTHTALQSDDQTHEVYIIPALTQLTEQINQARQDLMGNVTEALFAVHSQHNNTCIQHKQRRIKRENELIALDSTRLLLLNDINDSDGVTQKLRQQMNTARLQCEQIQASINALTEQQQSLPLKLQAIVAQLSGHGVSLNSLTTTMPSLETTHNELQYGTKAQLEKQQLKLTAMIANVEKQLRNARDDIFILNKEITALTSTAQLGSKLSASLASQLPGVHSVTKKSKKLQQNEQNMAALKLNEVELVRQLDQHRTMLVGVMSQLESKQKMNVDSAQRLATAKQSSNQHRAEITALTEQQHSMTQELQCMPARMQGLQSQLSVHTGQYTQLNEQLSQVTKQLQHNTNKLNQLTERKVSVYSAMTEIIEAIQAIQLIDAQMYTALQHYSTQHLDSVLCNAEWVDDRNVKYTGLLHCNRSALYFESCCISTQLHAPDFTMNTDTTGQRSVMSPVLEPLQTPANQQHSQLQAIQHICYHVPLDDIVSIEPVSGSSENVAMLRLSKRDGESSANVHIIGKQDSIKHLFEHVSKQQQRQHEDGVEQPSNNGVVEQWQKQLQQLDTHSFTTRFAFVESPSSPSDDNEAIDQPLQAGLTNGKPNGSPPAVNGKS